jgi:hypothetical protein
MYTLSWYDLIAWMPLAVLGASKLDQLMLLRIAPLSLAYVPGRAIDVGDALDWTANRVRDTFSPLVQMAVLVAVVLWWRHPQRPELFPRRSTAPEPVAVPGKRGGKPVAVPDLPRPAPAGSASRRRR